MIDISVEHSVSAEGRQKQQLKVAGRATIASAAQLKEALLETLGAADEVLVDLSQTAEMDITALQLLCAAHGSATRGGKRFTVEDGGSGIYQKVVEDAGFERHVGCLRDTTQTCIWTGR